MWIELFTTGRSIRPKTEWWPSWLPAKDGTTITTFSHGITKQPNWEITTWTRRKRLSISSPGLAGRTTWRPCRKELFAAELVEQETAPIRSPWKIVSTLWKIWNRKRKRFAKSFRKEKKIKIHNFVRIIIIFFCRRRSVVMFSVHYMTHCLYNMHRLDFYLLFI